MRIGADSYVNISIDFYFALTGLKFSLDEKQTVFILEEQISLRATGLIE